MRTNIMNEAVFYSLSASMGHTTQVDLIVEVHTYQTFGLKEKTYITDLRAIFKQDTTLKTPYGLLDFNNEFKQSHVNQVPATMTLTSCELDDEMTFYSLFTHSSSAEAYVSKATSITKDYFNAKLRVMDENDQLLKANVFGKLLTLILTKFGHLDPDTTGLMYEADKLC